MPLNSSARDALATYVAPRLSVEKPSIKAAATTWPHSASPQAGEPIFESQKGGALTTSAMGQMIADLVKAAGALVPEETSAHTLRHRGKQPETFCCTLIIRRSRSAWLYQTARQNRTGTGAPPASSGRNDPASFGQDFVWLALVCASHLQIGRTACPCYRADIAETLHDLAAFREQQGYLQEALALYQRALAIREQALGEMHPRTRATRERLTALRERGGHGTGAPRKDDSSPEQGGQST